MKRRILITAGGTGGHLFPAQALAKELLDSHEVLFASNGLTENAYFDKTIFPYVEIPNQRPSKRRFFSFLFSLCRGIRASLRTVRKFRPDLIVGFGSYHSIPILSAAKIRGIPYVLFESNAVPGKVNRFFSQGAKVTGSFLPISSRPLKGRVKQVSMPFFNRTSPEDISHKEAMDYFGLEEGLLVLLIFGGSQGGVSLNRALQEVIPFLDPNIQVLHFTGKMKEKSLEKAYKKRGIHACVKPFEERMDLAYAVADCTLCRSGALTIAELIDHAMPALLIPYPWSTDEHQKHNALVFEKTIGGGKILFQDRITADEINAFMQEDLGAYRRRLAAYNKTQKHDDLLSLVEEVL